MNSVLIALAVLLAFAGGYCLCLVTLKSTLRSNQAEIRREMQRASTNCLITETLTSVREQTQRMIETIESLDRNNGRVLSLVIQEFGNGTPTQTGHPAQRMTPPDPNERRGPPDALAPPT